MQREFKSTSISALGTLACCMLLAPSGSAASGVPSDLAAIFSEAVAISRYSVMPLVAVSKFTEDEFASRFLGEREIDNEARSNFCFGSGTDRPALTASEVSAEIQAILASYSAAAASVQMSAVMAFQASTAGLSFSGCRLAFEPDPWSKVHGTYFIARERDVRIGFNYGWTE